jgi:hypothetical protein
MKVIIFHNPYVSTTHTQNRHGTRKYKQQNIYAALESGWIICMLYCTILYYVAAAADLGIMEGLPLRVKVDVKVKVKVDNALG